MFPSHFLNRFWVYHLVPLSVFSDWLLCFLLTTRRATSCLEFRNLCKNDRNFASAASRKLTHQRNHLNMFTWFSADICGISMYFSSAAGFRFTQADQLDICCTDKYNHTEDAFRHLDGGSSSGPYIDHPDERFFCHVGSMIQWLGTTSSWWSFEGEVSMIWLVLFLVRNCLPSGQQHWVAWSSFSCLLNGPKPPLIDSSKYRATGYQGEIMNS